MNMFSRSKQHHLPAIACLDCSPAGAREEARTGSGAGAESRAGAGAGARAGSESDDL